MTAGDVPMHSGKAWAQYFLKKKFIFILNRTVVSHIKKFLTLLNKLYLQASYLITLVLPHLMSATAIFNL